MTNPMSLKEHMAFVRDLVQGRSVWGVYTDRIAEASQEKEEYQSSLVRNYGLLKNLLADVETAVWRIGGLLDDLTEVDTHLEYSLQSNPGLDQLRIRFSWGEDYAGVREGQTDEQRQRAFLENMRAILEPLRARFKEMENYADYPKFWLVTNEVSIECNVFFLPMLQAYLEHVTRQKSETDDLLGVEPPASVEAV
jgi:hypothetical protein